MTILLFLLIRTNLQAVKPAIVREITQRVATSSGRISSSSAGDQGIQSRSLQREFLDRDFDSQTFQTVENQAEGDVDGNEGEHEEQELVEVVPVVGQKGVFVYKNVVAVVGSSQRTVDEAQVEPVNEEEDIEGESYVNGWIQWDRAGVVGGWLVGWLVGRIG